jgi:hypothetical protein
MRAGFGHLVIALLGLILALTALGHKGGATRAPYVLVVIGVVVVLATAAHWSYSKRDEE